MTSDRLEHGVWVLICDGRKALLVENTGDAEALNFKVRQTLEHSDPPTREQGTDKPGRRFSGDGARRSATESTDFHALAEQDFLKSLGTELERVVAEGRIGGLVLAAPPEALGVLRRSLSPAVQKIVRGEVEKDYVNMPIDEVEHHLPGALAARRSRD